MLHAKYLKRDSHIGVPIVAQWVKNPPGIREDVGLVPSLVQENKDLAMLQAASYGEDTSQIWCCYGYSLWWELQLQVWLLKEKKKKKSPM